MLTKKANINHYPKITDLLEFVNLFMSVTVLD